MRQELPHYRGAAPVVGYSMQNGVLICSELPGEILPEAPKALDRGIPTRRTPIISDCRRETVRKGLLGERLGTLPSMRRAYQTDLSDAEWSYIEPHLPTPKAPGRPRVHTLREILDAIFYIVRSGCPWRLLPHDFPPWKTVHHYFRTWRIDGTWERIHAALRYRVRVRKKRDPQPSAGVVDSQSLKSTGGVGGDQRGYDGGKKVKGRKRHLLVDTEGLVLKVRVHSAKVMDHEGIKILLKHAAEMFPRLSHLWLDGGYRGEDKGKDWVEKALGWS